MPTSPLPPTSDDDDVAAMLAALGDLGARSAAMAELETTMPTAPVAPRRRIRPRGDALTDALLSASDASTGPDASPAFRPTRAERDRDLLFDRATVAQLETHSADVLADLDSGEDPDSMELPAVVPFSAPKRRRARPRLPRPHRRAAKRPSYRTAVRDPRFAKLGQLAQSSSLGGLAGGLWNGRLGWRANSIDVAYVRRKMLVRYGVLLVTAALISGLASLPLAGSAYGAPRPFVAAPAGTWTRGPVDYPVVDRAITLEDGSAVPARVLRGLRALTVDIAPAIDRAAAGDATALDAVFTARAQAAFAAPLAARLAGAKATFAFGGVAANPNLLTFLVAAPSGNPTTVTGAFLGPTTFAAAGADGSPRPELNANAYRIELVFVTGDGGWRIDGVTVQ